MIKLIIADVDDTLAESRQPITEDIANLIIEILKQKYFCIISGGDENSLYKRFKPLIDKEFNEKNFLISATSGAGLFKLKNKKLYKIYKEKLTQSEKTKIINIIQALIDKYNLKPILKDAGSIIEDRNSQITLSCLGYKAPKELKYKWDANLKKRKKMLKYIYKGILDVDGIAICIGGTTSIDFTREGIGKKYGIKKVLEYLNLDRDEAIFFGDKTHKQGNDYIDNYVKTVQVNIPLMKQYLQEITKGE